MSKRKSVLRNLFNFVIVAGAAAMIVYLILAIIKERYLLKNSLSQLLHFLEVNLFEKKALISIFRPNPRKMHRKEEDGYKQLTLFDY